MNLLSEDRQLVGRIYAPARGENSGSAILFVHGLRSNQTGYVQYAKRAAAVLGATCLTFDLGGHGESAGCLDRLTPMNHMNDLLTAYDLLVKQDGVAPDRVGACGGSYGAYLASFLTKHRRVSRVLLRAPALYADDLFGVPFAQSRNLSATVTAPRLSSALHDFKGSLLVVESGNDEVIPTGVIDWYVGARGGAQRTVLEGALHALVNEAEKEAFVQAAIDFFGGM